MIVASKLARRNYRMENKPVSIVYLRIPAALKARVIREAKKEKLNINSVIVAVLSARYAKMDGKAA
jgi:hypothetical protein